MANLTIGDKTVTVDDAFLSLSPEEQNATVEEIAGSLGVKGAEPEAPKEDKSYTGGILPFSNGPDGKAQFDSNAGIVGSIKRAITLPRDVYDGKVDLNTDEGLGRVLEGAGTINPAVPYLRGVRGTPILSRPQEAAPAVEAAARPINPIVQQAERLSAEGAPVRVPVGVASEKPAVQAAFQRGAQTPGASGVVSKSVDDFVGDVGTKANELALRAAERGADEGLPTPDGVGSGIRTSLERAVDGNETAAQQTISQAELNARSQISAAEAAAQQARQGFDDLVPQAPQGTKAQIGDDLTQALEQRTAFHRAEQEKPYVAMRQLIQADAPVPLPQSLNQTFQAIGAARAGAGFDPWPGGTQAVARVLTRGDASFNDLQRLRSHIGGMIDDWKPGSGFDQGDLKRIYGELTGAMKSAASASAKGGASKAALSAFEKAEANFASRSSTIGDLNGLLRNGPESLVDRMVGYASEKGSANYRKLQALQNELPGEVQEKVSRLAFQRLSRGSDGEFSESVLVKNWANLSPEGKRALFKGNAPKIEAAVKNLQAASAGAKATRELAEAALSAETKAAQAKAKNANKEYVRLLAQSDEQITRSMLQLARDGATANASKLAQMASLLGADHMKSLASLQIQQLGRGQNGVFSVAALRSSWNDLSGSGKAMLFPDLGLRRSLEDIVAISERAATAQKKFGNSSGSGGSVGQILTGGALMADPITTVSTLLGANVMARVLARPATSKPLLDYSKAMEAYIRRPSAQTAKAVSKAAEKLANQVAAELGVKVEVTQLLGSDQPSARSAVSGPR